MGFFENRDDAGQSNNPFQIGGGDQFRSPISIRWIGLGAALLILFVVANVAKSLYVDWLWFDSVHYGSVFRTIVVWKVSLFLAGAVISALVIGVNIWLARRLAPEGLEESKCSNSTATFLNGYKEKGMNEVAPGDILPARDAIASQGNGRPQE